MDQEFYLDVLLWNNCEDTLIKGILLAKIEANLKWFTEFNIPRVYSNGYKGCTTD